MLIRQLDHDIELFNFRLGEDFYTSRGLEVPVRARSTHKPTTALPKKSEGEVPSTPGASASADATTGTPLVAVGESPAAEKLQPLKTSIKLEPQAPAIAEAETQTFVPEEDGYRCPVEDCRKLFRRDNLLGVRFTQSKLVQFITNVIFY